MAKRRLPVVLTETEQTALLAQPNPRYITGERNRILLRVFLNAGLRLAEAVRLRWRDLDLNSGKLVVREGKGAKDQTLWVSEEDLELLQGWRERQAQKAEARCEHVFTSVSKGTVGRPINRRYVQEMVKRYAKKAGIAKDISPHTLRHTFATDLYRQTKNIRLVQKALGHADLSTTMIYTHIVDEELEGAMKGFRSAGSGGESQPLRSHDSWCSQNSQVLQVFSHGHGRDRITGQAPPTVLGKNQKGGADSFRIYAGDCYGGRA